jgi:hypothetical protein
LKNVICGSSSASQWATDARFRDLDLREIHKMVTMTMVARGCTLPFVLDIHVVWWTALESGFREGRDAKLSIDDADPDPGPGVVEAMLGYAYAGEFDCDTP